MSDKEIFDIKSECGFLNKSVKKLMQENEQQNSTHRQLVEQQQEFYNKKIDSFFEKIETIHNNTERKVNSLERDISIKRETEEGNKRLL